MGLTEISLANPTDKPLDPVTVIALADSGGQRSRSLASIMSDQFA